MKGQGCLNCWWSFRRYDYAITELEKIKAEITMIKHEYWKDFAKFDRAKGIEEVIKILDNHIEELKKGENK